MSGLTLRSIRPDGPTLLQRIAGAVVAALLAAGIAGGLLALAGAQLPAPSLAVSAACGAAVVAAAGFFTGRGRRELVFYLAAAIAVAALCAALSGLVLGGGAQVANAFLLKVGARTQFYALPYAEGGEAGLTLFCALATTLIALVSSLLAQRGGAVAACALSIIALVGLASGWVDAGWWMVPFALGVLGCACLRTLFAGDRTGRSAPASTIAGVVAVCLVATGAVAAATRNIEADTSAPNAAIDDLLWSFRYGDAAFAMPEGRLAGLGPLEQSDQVAMNVEVDGTVHEYLRGFTGERYEGDEWTALPAEEVMGARGLFYWLAEDGFSAASQLSQATEAVGYDEAKPATLRLTYGTVRAPYAYLPYGYAGGKEAEEVTDLAQTRAECRGEATVALGSDLARQAYRLQERLEGASGDAVAGGDVPLRSYLDDEAAYRDFVHEAYLQVPDSLSAAFESLWGAPVELTSEQAKIVVQNILDATVTYNPDAGGEPEGDEEADAGAAGSDGAAAGEDGAEAEQSESTGDFVLDFLTVDRTGYSVHYASAAVMILRYYGVPARYVEGYVLDTQRLDEEAAAEAEEGTAEGGNAADDVAGEGGTGSDSYTLTERQAHAWAEYYLDGVGWIPFDVTPGWGSGSYYLTASKTELQEDVDNWSVGMAEEDALWTPPEQDESDSEDQQEEPSPIFGDIELPPFSWPWALVGFLVVLAAAFVIRDMMLHRRIGRFLEAGRAGRLGLAPRRADALPPRFADLGRAPGAIGSEDAGGSVEAVGAASGADAAPGNWSSSVEALFSYAVMLARECGGMDFGADPLVGQGSMLEEAGLCPAEDFDNAARANARALYSAGGAGERDAADVLACIDALRAGLREQTSIASRFVQRHIRCQW